MVRAAETVGRDPRSGFTALNLLLLAGAAVVLVKRVSTVAAVLLAAGPILWWIDKPHPEVFTFGLIAVAIASVGRAPWLTILALGLASAQEPVIVPALVAGCTVVLKPAPESPLDAFWLTGLFEEAGLPEGVLSVVPAGREVAEHLVVHPGVDQVAFTGSTEIGRASCRDRVL